MNFSNTAELREQVRNLPLGKEKELFRLQDENKYSESYEPVEEHKAIINSRNDEIATITSAKYNLIQHEDAFSPVLSVLDNLDFSWRGEMRTWKNGQRVVADVSSPEMGFEIDEDSEYNGGFRMANSFDRSTAFKLMAYVGRAVCSNGMVFGGELVQEPLYRKHIGSNPVENIQGWIMGLADELPNLRSRIIASQSEYYEPFKVLEALDIPDKHAEEIVSPENKKEISRKELYDRFTSYLSHEYREHNNSLSREEKYWRKSEELLTGDLDQKIKRLETQEA